MSRPDIDIRTLTGEQDLRTWERALATGFLREPVVYDEDVEMRLASIDLDRTRGAFDGARCVGTFRTFAQELTVPGGAAVPGDAVSNVTVSPTHRRRGLLSRMMAADLAEAKDRGDAVATLIAAEYPIYGRYGFGPATWIAEWEVDATRAQLDPRYAGPQDGGRVELVDGVDVRGFGPAFHDRFRALQHGAVSRPAHWWAMNTGESRFRTMGPWVEPFYAVYRSAAGEIEGLVAYRADDKWEAKLPHDTATVLGLQATTPAAERALWHYLLSIDWITTVATGHRAPDDLLPLCLGDPRAARMTAYADFLWIRPLDVPRLLASRTYGTSGSLVLDLHDKAGLANGRFLLRADDGGASCEPTTRTADLSLDAADFGPLYLGDESAVRLTALGRIDEERPGAATLADAMLRTPRRPWCPDVF